MVKDIRIADYNYELPDGRIARHPLSQRDACKLLVSRHSGEIRHDEFFNLPDYISTGSLIVCNDTRVINARIKFEKSTGSKIEVFLLEPICPEDYVLMFQTRTSCRWSCLVGNLKRWKQNPLVKMLSVDGRDVLLTALRKEALPGNAHDIEFTWDDDSLTFASIIDAAGSIPVPPYLKRESEQCDTDDYQTVYASIKGSVAAPTAGLHFTEELFTALRNKGAEIKTVTLHVGAGTFQPVKSEAIGDHPMHTEVFTVSRDLVEALISSLKEGSSITAIGTTSVRTLESLPYVGRHIMEERNDIGVSQWEAYDVANSFNTIEALKALADYMNAKGLATITASTSIMIAPGFPWRIVDAMVTNFHQPESTLLLLVSSFLGADSDGKERWRKLYDAALADSYRFLSYGDACYFENKSTKL